MKGSALFQFIQSLSDEELTAFRAILAQEKDHELLLRLVSALLEMVTYSEPLLLEKLGTSRSKKNELLKAVDFSTTHLISHSDLELRLSMALNTARKLVFRIENEPAIHIMTWAIRESLRIERFDLTLEFVDLADILTEPHDFDTPPKTELIRLQHNILSYRFLEERLRGFFQPGTSKEEGRKLLEEVGQDRLMESEEEALSKRALVHYLKIRSGLFKFRGNDHASLAPQARLIELVKETEWLKPDNDFFLINEMGWLMTLLASVQEYDKANHLAFRVGNIEAAHLRSEQEKIAKLYPFRIAIAIVSGNQQIGDDAVEECTRFIHSDQFSTKFRTTNLYYSAYYFIAKQDFAKAFRAITQLRKFSQSRAKASSNFYPRIYPMVRILEIVIAFETGEVEDALRLIRNFRNSKLYDGNRYYKILFGTIVRVLNSERSKWDSIFRKAFQQAIELDLGGWPGKLINYFDLPVWLASQFSTRSMLTEY